MSDLNFEPLVEQRSFGGSLLGNLVSATLLCTIRSKSMLTSCPAFEHGEVIINLLLVIIIIIIPSIDHTVVKFFSYRRVWMNTHIVTTDARRHHNDEINLAINMMTMCPPSPLIAVAQVFNIVEIFTSFPCLNQLERMLNGALHFPRNFLLLFFVGSIHNSTITIPCIVVLPIEPLLVIVVFDRL